MAKLLRITTVPISLKVLLKGQFAFMQQNGFEVHTASANGVEVTDVLEEGVVHHHIPFTRTINPIKDLQALYVTIQLIKRIKPDIVHSHTPKAGLIGMLAARICRVPIRLHTVAGMPLMEASGITKFVLDITERITYACASKVYPNSFQLKDWITTRYTKHRQKIQVLANGSSNGIDCEYYKLTKEIKLQAEDKRSDLGIDKSTKIFVFVGRLVRDKGINELVSAFTKFSNMVDDQVVLMLVGPFEDEREPVADKTKAVIEENRNILAVGFQNDIRPFLAMADVFVFPSYREGFPNVVMQAGNFNLPAVVTDINGCNELVKHEVNGLLVNPKSVEDLIKAMHRLLDDDLRERLSKTARVKIESLYTQPLVWQSLLDEYKKLLTEHNVQ